MKSNGIKKELIYFEFVCNCWNFGVVAIVSPLIPIQTRKEEKNIQTHARTSRPIKIIYNSSTWVNQIKSTNSPFVTFEANKNLCPVFSFFPSFDCLFRTKTIANNFFSLYPLLHCKGTIMIETTEEGEREIESVSRALDCNLTTTMVPWWTRQSSFKTQVKYKEKEKQRIKIKQNTIFK